LTFEILYDILNKLWEMIYKCTLFCIFVKYKLDI
jgi:hypothetical protein